MKVFQDDSQVFSAGFFVLLQAVFRRAGGLIYVFLLLSCGIRLLMFQPCFDRILICLIRSLIYYTAQAARAAQAAQTAQEERDAAGCRTD